jgi:Zn finger protein HypA/HybF involved in hydrogenase expression
MLWNVRGWPSTMALVVIKTSTANGYCECICGCYELSSQRDEESGKGYCPRCAKEHLEMNRGVGLARIPPVKLEIPPGAPSAGTVPPPAAPPGRLH